MDVTRDKILGILYQCIDELNEQFVEEQRLLGRPETALLGDSGSLDSLGFVNLVAIVEDKFEGEFGVALSLTEDSGRHQRATAFDTVGALADFIRLLLVEGTTHS